MNRIKMRPHRGATTIRAISRNELPTAPYAVRLACNARFVDKIKPLRNNGRTRKLATEPVDRFDLFTVPLKGVIIGGWRRYFQQIYRSLYA